MVRQISFRANKFIYLIPVLALVILSVIYAFIYKALIMINPNSFIGLNQSSHAVDFLYYSLITATTTGYGDIYPVTTAGRIITISEILLGILIVLVALVYMTLYHHRFKK